MAVSKVVVLTTDLIRFEIEATHWITESIRTGDAVQYRVKLHVAGSGEIVAEFNDVAAVWHLAKGDIIKPDVPDDE